MFLFLKSPFCRASDADPLVILRIMLDMLPVTMINFPCRKNLLRR
jgi:hypothetical protein